MSDMTSYPGVRTLTIRIPQPLFDSLQRAAKRRGKSMNKIVEDALSDLEARERLERLQDGLRKLGARGTEVEFAIDAQSEVALRDED